MSSCLGKENKLDAEMCCRFIVIGLNEAHISLLQIVVVTAWQFLCFRAVTNELLEAPRPPLPDRRAGDMATAGSQFTRAN